MPSIEDQVFSMKFAAKSLVRESKKSEKEAKKNKTKCKKAMQSKNMDVAKIYAQNAIRQEHEALNFLKLSSRMDAVAARLQSAAKMNSLTSNMKSIVKSMDKVLTNMDAEQMSMVMDKFEQQFDDLDVVTDYMDKAMVSSNVMTTPDDQVDLLMQQVADENDIEFMSDLQGPKRVAQDNKVEEDEEDELAARLRKLQGI